jgi:hypothetical protein
LGLRELGIASELGLSSLSIPKRLLKGKRNAKGPNATYGITLFTIISFLLMPLLSQRKVRRTSSAVSPTAAVCSTYLGGRQEPDRVAPWLLRTSSRGTRLASRRSTKSCSSEARPAWTGDPAEQRGHRSRSRRRIKEEDQAKRWRSSSSSSRSCRRSFYRDSNCGNNTGWGVCWSHVGSSGRCDTANDSRVEQRQFAEPVGGISCTVGLGYGGNYNPYWRGATAVTDTEEEESYNRSGHWWGWRYGQEARTAARRPTTCRRGECVRSGRIIFWCSNLLLSILCYIILHPMIV